MTTKAGYQLLDSLHAPTAVTSQDSTILYVNKAWNSFARSNGYTGDTFVGRRYLDVCDLADGTEMDDALLFARGFKYVAGGEWPCFEMTYQCHSSESNRWFKTILQPIGDNVLVNHLEVNAERAARQSSAGQAGLVHDMKTPLTAVIGYADFVLDSSPERLSSSKLREIFGTIRTAGQRALSLVTAMMDDTGSGELHAAPTADDVDAETVIQEVIGQCRPLAAKHGVEISSKLFAGSSLLADRDMLWRMISNLIGNAIKFNRPDGRIIASMDLNASGGLEISILDTGIGVERDKLARIFESRVRNGGRDGTANIEGSGLGLAVVRDLARLHDARLRISSAPNVGTTITIMFPAWRTTRNTPLSHHQNFDGGGEGDRLKDFHDT